MKRILWAFFPAFLAVSGLPLPAEAACSNPAGTEGEQIYNVDHKTMQFCDGTDWYSMKAIATSGGGGGTPTGCPNIGDVCSDGTIYAGDTLGPLYTLSADTDSNSYWGTYNYTTGETSVTDGATNTTNIYAHVIAGDGNNNPDDGSNPNAVQLCEELIAHGYTDWYLPAKTELNDLYLNRAAIGNFFTAYYWSSTEHNATNVWYQHFLNGNQNSNDTKNNQNRIRCVRRD